MSQPTTDSRVAHIDYIKSLVDALARQERSLERATVIELADVIKRELDILVRPEELPRRRWTDTVHMPA